MAGNRWIEKLLHWFNGFSKGKKIAICSAGILLLIVLIGGIFLAGKLNKIDTDDISQEDILMNDDLISSEGYTNIALFGIDSRSGELEKGTRTDCLIIASLNNETKEVKMVSVYRDTVLDIEENYLQKCNAAYAFGGATQAINMLNRNLDLNIQDYVTVDFAAIANTIDLLGGLEIEIKPEEVKPLNKYVKETAKVAGKKAKKIDAPGLQLLDGVQATTYARIRSTAGGDFTRTERQRLVIKKIVEKAQKTDFATINKIIDELLPTIKTSFTSTEILAYAKYFAKYQIADSSGFPFEKTTATVSGLGSIVIPVTLEDNVKQLHEFFFGTEGYTPSEVVSSISSAVVARVGQREATDYSTLSTQTYVDTAEDKAQEKNEYAPPTKEEMEADKKAEEKKEANKQDESTNATESEDVEQLKPEKEQEIKPESKPESKPEDTSESKPETKPESEPESKPESKPESELESKPEDTPDNKPEVKPESKPEETPESKPESEPEVKPEEIPDDKPENEQPKEDNSGEPSGGEAEGGHTGVEESGDSGNSDNAEVNAESDKETEE